MQRGENIPHFWGVKPYDAEQMGSFFNSYACLQQLPTTHTQSLISSMSSEIETAAHKGSGHFDSVL
jgi:hypothetical protein